MFYNKIKWILGISMVFFLILATNYVDRNNFRRVQDSIETMYEDRLIAHNLIFKMSLAIQEKVMAKSIAEADLFLKKNKAANAELEQLTETFRNTKLTPKEAVIFEDFESNFLEIRQLEKAVAHKGKKLDEAAYTKELGQLNKNINALSEIQLDEGRRQLFIGKRAVETAEFLTTIEVYVLIFLAILVQIIVIYNPKSKPES